jgi:bifunctional N-acetylglucosamine-1-phosphate-uridyltransferase/glucosamine-1-phosphate-acetyltransferase GlmU-like protein
MVLIGAGGACIDTLSFFNLKNTPIFDDYKVGSVMGNRIYGTVDDLIRMRPTDDIFNCIGSVGDNTVRNRIYEKLKAAGIKTKPLLLCSFLSGNVKIGSNVLAGVGSQLHHDVTIENNVVISPGVIICGDVTLKKNCFIGAGSVLIQGITVGRNSIAGAGSVVINDVPDNCTVVGNPARIIKG